MAVPDAFGQLAVFSSVRVPTTEIVSELFQQLTMGADGSAWWRDQGEDAWHLGPPEAGLSDAVRFALTPALCCSLMPVLTSEPLFRHVRCVTIELSSLAEVTGTGRPPLLSIFAGAWTCWPESNDLAPLAPPGLATAQTWSPSEAAELFDEFLLPKVITPLLDTLTGDVTSVFAPQLENRVCRPPVLYMARPVVHVPTEPDDWFGDADWTGLANELAKPILGVPNLRDNRLAGSIQAISGTVTLFRQWELAHSLLPNFLVLPARSDRWSDSESDARMQLIFLSSLDTEATYLLWDASTDYEIVLDRLGDFRSIVDEAAAVLNPLMLALLTAQGSDLEVVRDAVNGVRTTLLQSGPELNGLRGILDRQRDRIESVRLQISRYRRGLGERAPDGMVHLDEALLRTPIFESLAHSDGLAQAALRNVEPVQELIDSTASVLAEHREQALARLGRTTYALNLVLLVLAVATTIDLLVHFNWGTTYSWVAPALRTALFAAFLLVATWLIIRHVRGGRGARSDDRESAELRARIVTFLQTAAAANSRMAESDDWEALDRSLAGELAELWDQVEKRDAGLPRSVDTVGELDAMVDRAESWIRRALLIGERPCPISPRLPRVACVYHFWKAGHYVSSFEFRQALSGAVAADDLERFRDWGCALPGTVETCRDLMELVDRELVRVHASNVVEATATKLQR
jgi:hypothetical protein